MVNELRLVDQFMSLVQVDSETKHEQQISIVLKQLFKEHGLTVTEDDTMEKTGHGANNLFVSIPATSGYESVEPILFTAHMDTVTPGVGIKPQLDDDGYIRSDGTTILGSDDKAGIAIIFEVIRLLEEHQIPHGRIQIVITVGEESGLVGARAIDPAMLDATYGFALDSNGDVGELCVAAPTQSKIHVAVIGKTAHAGVNPEDGISAIQIAGKAISRMKLGRIDFETTANIGKFFGGGPTNIVCDRVDIDAEARSLDPDKLAAQVASMKDAFEQTAAEFGGRVEFTSNILYTGYKYDESDPIVQLTAKAVRKIGLTPKLEHSGGGSDANIFNGLGIPTINLAIGYEHIHTTKEQIPVKSMVEVTKLVLEIIRTVTEEKSL